MSWTKVLPVESLAPGTRRVVKVGGRPILLLNDDGQLRAVDNRCPHLRLPMEKGRVEDGKIACPWHRSSFDLCTGEVVEWITWPPLANRAMAILAKEKALPVFPVRVEEGSIWVDVNYRSTSDSSS